MNNTQENIQKRRERILDHINACQRTNVNDIAAALSLSAITVRRDVDALAEEKKVVKFFGGVRSAPPVRNEPVPPVSVPLLNALSSFPDAEKVPAVLAIAKTAADFIDNGDVILMGSSRTASYVLDYLGNKSVTVFTNSLFSLGRNIGPNVRLCLLGGQVQRDRSALVGGITLEGLGKISANKCLLGVDGIDVLTGLTSQYLEEAYVNQQIIRQTHGKVIVVADGSKIEKKSAFYFGSLESGSVLITDSSASSLELSHFTNSGVNVHVVHPSP